MARFTSQYGSLTLQGDGDEQPYAVFEGGVFETSDADVVARLHAVADGSVTEDASASEDVDDATPSRRGRARRGVPAVDGDSSGSSMASSSEGGSSTAGAEGVED